MKTCCNTKTDKINTDENYANENICDAKTCIFGKIIKLYRFKLSILEEMLAPIALLATRIYLGLIFWRSGQTKIDNLDNTTMLFEWEYIPAWEKNSTKTIFGMDINFPIPTPEFAGTMSTYTELAMPVLLWLGLMGRVGALILFGMAASIELFVYPGTTDHYFWMLLLSTIVFFGPGKISVDYLVRSSIVNDQPKNSKIWNIILFGLASVFVWILAPTDVIYQELTLNTLILGEIFIIGLLTVFALNRQSSLCCRHKTSDS